MSGYTDKKRYAFLYISAVFLMMFIFIFVIYREKCDRKNDFKIIVGEIYDKSPEAADIILNQAFELKENTKLKTNTAINNISGSSKVIKKAIKQADRAAYSLGYTDKAYDILFDKDFSGIKKYELLSCAFFILLVLFSTLSIYFWKKNIIMYLKNVSERISLALSEKKKFKKADGGRFYFLEKDIEDLINIQINLKNYIDKRETDMQKFMENIAHQIKTPLARILLNLDMLSSLFEESFLENNYEKDEKAEDKKIADKLIADSLSSGEEIKRHIMMLLNLARMEAGKVHFRKDIVDLASILEKIVDRFGRKNFDADINSMGEVYIVGDEEWLFEAISNLVDNSIAHGNSQKPIQIRVREFDTDVRVSLTDFGSGISNEEISKVFDRYYTGSDSDSYSTGIGMNLARYVIEAHYSDIRLSSSDKTGLKIEFNLPKPELKQKIRKV